MNEYDVKFEFVSRITTDEKYKDLKLPERNTKLSAGYDFYNPDEVTLEPKQIVYVKTGVKSKFVDSLCLKLYNRSSNPKKKGLVLINGVGVVDADYYNNTDNEGEIAFAFMNITDKPVTIGVGEKLGQGIFERYYTTAEEQEITNERTGGFGSTGA